MICVYAASLTNVPDPAGDMDIMRHIPEKRRERILKYGWPEDRIRSLGAELLLKEILPKHHADYTKIRRNGYGKPEVHGLQFNISHSGEIVICAVSDRPVGCDVEKIRSAPEGVPAHFFSEKEQEYLSSFTDGRYDETFFRIWTAKESYIKMTGEGMRIPLNSFTCDMKDEIRVFRDGIWQPCHVKEYALSGYHIAVCGEESVFSRIAMTDIMRSSYKT